MKIQANKTGAGKMNTLLFVFSPLLGLVYVILLPIIAFFVLVYVISESVINNIRKIQRRQVMANSI